MRVRRLVVPVAMVVGMLGVPQVAEAAPTPVRVKVVGAQNYGGRPAFVGSTGTPGLTVTGVTCSGLTNDVAITRTLKALQPYKIAGATCSGGTLSDPGYEIAGYDGSTFSVYRAPLSVKADDLTKVYRQANSALSYTVTGFVNNQNSSVLKGEPTLSTKARRTSRVGNYPISIAAGTLKVPSNNYFLRFLPGVMSVTPKPVAVGVGGAQIFGEAPAFVAATGITDLTASGVSCTSLATGEPIGPTLAVGSDYAVDPASCSGGVLSDANYMIASYRSSFFRVLKATLTVRASDMSRTYGFGNPPFAHTITGFKNDDDESDLTGVPSLSTTAVVKSNAGSYPIDAAVGSLRATNYRFAFVAGTLTVLKKQLTVTAEPATRAYGDPDPTFRATFTGFRNGDSATVLTGVPKFSTTAGPASDPGTYPLTVAKGTLGSPNYTFVGFNLGGSTLTITQGVPAIVTTKMVNGVLSATVTYGAANTPVAGSTITFKVGKSTTTACSALTNASGKAECTATGAARNGIALSGYTAQFPGTSALLSGEKFQGTH